MRDERILRARTDELAMFVLSIVDGLAAMYFAAVAFDFWHVVAGREPIERLVAPAMLPSIAAVLRAPPWPLETLLLVATFLAGLALSPLLIRYLRRFVADDAHAFLTRGALAGVAYACATVAGTGLLVLPLAAMLGGGLGSVGAAEALLVSLMFAALGGILYSVTLSPVVVSGGALVGVLNAAIVRRTRRG